LLPFDVVMVPLPDQEPDIAVNGLLEACTAPGRAARLRRPAAAATARVDFTLWVKALVIENTFALPWNWFSSLVVETP
jgi:hypothetical protein